MYRILRILNRFNLGGPIYNASYLSAGLQPQFETLLIGGAPEAGEASSRYIPERLGVETRIIDQMHRRISLSSDRAAYRHIRTVVRDFKPDIVHTHASKAGALGRIAAISERVPVVVHTFHGHVFHSYFGRAKTAFYLQLERQLAHRSSAIIAISEAQHHDLTQRFKVSAPEKTHIIPLGFDLQRFTVNRAARRLQFRALYDLNDEVVAIGIIGRFASIKNHRLFVRAFAILAQQSDRPVRGFVIGDGSERAAIEAEASDCGLSFQNAPYDGKTRYRTGENTLIFTSWVPAIEEVLPGLDLVALTSDNEGTPVSLIEAQAAGVAVVSTAVGGVADVVQHETTGLLVAAGQIAPFAEALDLLVHNDALRKTLAQAAPAHVLERYSKDRLVRDTSALYESLL